jgi:SAM-dependent methyltransferase
MNLKPLAARTCGIDLDPRVASNPFLDEGVVGSAEDIPYPSELFDLVLANNVLEHLESPERVLAEVYRVLKPGGLFIAKTPNKYHYVPLIASLTPHRFHAWVNSLRGREPEDTFPTRYLANRPSVLRRMGEGAGFAEVVIQMVEGRPEYLRWNAACYLAGICYERLVNSLAPLETLRVVLIAEFAKGHPQMLRHGSGARGLN